MNVLDTIEPGCPVLLNNADKIFTPALFKSTSPFGKHSNNTFAIDREANKFS